MIYLIKGDLLDLEGIQYIAHQTNCNPGAMGGLAGDIVNKYPQANTRNGVCKPGEIDVFFPIINIYGQYNMGYPSRKEPTNLRLRWFKRGLWLISRIPNLESIAFPYKTGCGLAGGKWEDYEALLVDFAHYVYYKNHVQVYVVKYE